MKSVNSLRAEEVSERDRVGREVADSMAKGKWSIAELDAEIAAKGAEVSRLRKEREEEMRPIEEVRAEADTRNAKSREREEELEKAESDFRMVVTGFKENANDAEQELHHRSKELNEREAGIRREMAALKESETRLVGKWTEYHAAAEVANERARDIVQREDRASASEKANADRATFLDGQEENIANRERLLRSNYQALEEAKKHLGIK